MNYTAKKWDFKHNGVERLKPYIEDRYLARTLEEVGIFLPKQRIHVERVELDPEVYPLQARTVRQVTEFYQIMLSTGETMTLMHLITVILRKRQAMVWPGGIEIRDKDKESPTYGEILFSVGSEVQESCKMDAAQERILELHAQGRRQVVFSQFKSALKEFAARLEAQGLRVARFDGDTPEADRLEIKTNFYAALKEEPKWDVVLVHYKAGGSGLNLTAATAIHILDEEWNAGKRNQAYKRIHRIGQEHESDVYVYRVPNSVDTWMSNLIEKKDRMMKRLGQTMSNARMLAEIREALKGGDL
jgi:SNF2 family DNA or RNA helicase